jgi:hypothetical protein
MQIFLDNPLFRFLYWILNTPGVGAFVVVGLGASLLLVYGRVLRWITNGGKAIESSIYSYPTQTLHRHE